jgi:hypothetical protein
MPDRPPLLLATPTVGPRQTRPGRGSTITGPGTAAQTARLEPKLQRLTTAFSTGRLTTTTTPAAALPDQVVVLEVAGELATFANAVRRIPGLEFLADEADEKVDADAEFAAVDQDGRRRRYNRQLFLVASDAVAWQQILSLYQTWKAGQRLPHGLTAFRDLFARLRDVRAWNDHDRLERTGALDAWREDFAGLVDEPVEFEVELWHRSDPQVGQAEAALLATELADAGGEVVAQSAMSEIGYHGVLARVPARLLHDAVANREMRWMSTYGVRFFHAVGQISGSVPTDADPSSPLGTATRSLPVGAPRVAVLDGLPLAGHASLTGRIVVDDPDDWGSTTAARQRNHGTGIASVVVNGDLGSQGPPQTRPVYVRPILAPGPVWVRQAPEEFPRDRLVVDVMLDAVARMFVGDEPLAPTVKVIVLAVGDRIHQFDRFVSPLARLIDHLSFKHNVLFLVSAGNHVTPMDVPGDLGLVDPQELQHEALCALQAASALRRLLAPGESVNALTIGASHSDASAAHTDDRLDPMVTPDLPNIVSAYGPGVRRAIKPDFLLPGGRQLVGLEPVRSDGRRPLSTPLTVRSPGVRMAAPGTTAGDLENTIHATGTSLAVALGGYHAGHLLQEVDDLRAGLRGQLRERLPESLDAVIAKAALAHSARWNTARSFIDEASNDILGNASRDAVSRMVGYGLADPTTAIRGDDHRATAIAAARIAEGEAHTYRFPLPASMSAQAVRRTLTMTLAWLTPINHEHRAYRRAALGLQPGGVELDPADLGVSFNESRRGTLQHHVLSGNRAVPYVTGSAIELAVSCRADAGSLTTDVPYAVIVSLATSPTLGLPIYDEVSQGLAVLLRQPLQIRPRG